jgi:hypothetical protein
MTGQSRSQSLVASKLSRSLRPTRWYNRLELSQDPLPTERKRKWTINYRDAHTGLGIMETSSAKSAERGGTSKA